MTLVMGCFSTIEQRVHRCASLHEKSLPERWRMDLFGDKLREGAAIMKALVEEQPKALAVCWQTWGRDLTLVLFAGLLPSLPGSCLGGCSKSAQEKSRVGL